jgi:hypothetical protein
MRSVLIAARCGNRDVHYPLASGDLIRQSCQTRTKCGNQRDGSSVSDVTTHPDAPGCLILRIENRNPIPASAVASLFDALSRDYRAASGHEIVVQEIRQGSWITVLRG